MNLNLVKKAEVLLSQCQTVTLSSLTETGYPRGCVLAKLECEGIKTLRFATGTSSHKTAQFRANAKASVCFYAGNDAVTLLGKVRIIDDAESKKRYWQDWFVKHFPAGPDDAEYTLLEFTSEEGTFYIDEEFETFSLD